MTDSEIVRRIVLAYEQAARNASDNNFITQIMPRESSKTWLNCLEVSEWCGKRGMDFLEYFKLAFAQFDKDWCLKKFHRVYPPFGVASSVVVLLRVEAALGKGPMRVARDRTVQEVSDTIRKHPAENWNLILENVYSYLPFDLKEEIRGNLNRGGV